MARYVTTVRTPLPPDEAFAFVADVERFADWDPGIAAATQVDGRGPGLGATYDLTVRGRRPFVMRYRVVTFEPPRRIVLTSTTTWLASRDTVTVAPDGAGASVTYDAELSLRGPLALFDPVLAVAFRRLGDRAAAGLRRALGGV